ncbi:MAG: helix-turn-helix domain-containing protein [Solirubrobacterales bacterium]|nr:helix-turn-helix domain-containing protein [Solirubrobacterales bacterium]
MDRPHQLAQFLRARRERLKPQDVGLPGEDRRRVPGLRREEVAMLAGISADYYMRLEQGRDHRPSEQVLEALARALTLDDDAADHLIALGRPAPPVRQTCRAAVEAVDPVLQDLLDAWTTVPALILGPRQGVLASNALARALTPLSIPGTNMLRAVFLDPDVRGRYGDIESVCAAAVANFRAGVGGDVEDADVKALVDELSRESTHFARLWGQHDVLSAPSGEEPFVHPAVGPMRLRYRTFAIGATNTITLLVVIAAPDSRETLARLARMATELDPLSCQPPDLTSPYRPARYSPAA